MTEFKITTPGFFRTRNGCKAEVEFISKHPDYPVVGLLPECTHPYTWSASGLFIKNLPHGMDIVAPWCEAPAEGRVEPAEELQCTSCKAKAQISEDTELYEWAYQDDTEEGNWHIGTTFRTEASAEFKRKRDDFKAKRRLRRFPSEDI